MYMSINVVAISGNLTRDCEVRHAANGNAVVRFTVAVNERKKNEFGEYENYANYIDCVMFGKYGEAIADSLKKGVKVSLGGSLRYSTWESNGQKRSKLEVIANSVDLPPKANLFDSKPQSEPQGYTDSQTSLYADDCPF